MKFTKWLWGRAWVESSCAERNALSGHQKRFEAILSKIADSVLIASDVHGFDVTAEEGHVMTAGSVLNFAETKEDVHDFTITVKDVYDFAVTA